MTALSELGRTFRAGAEDYADIENLITELGDASTALDFVRRMNPNNGPDYEVCLDPRTGYESISMETDSYAAYGMRQTGLICCEDSPADYEYSWCDYGNFWFPDSAGTYVSNHGVVSDYALNNSDDFGECYSCHDWHRDYNLTFCDADDCYYCPDCEVNMPGQSCDLLPYGTNVLHVVGHYAVIKGKRTPLTSHGRLSPHIMGVELETNMRRGHDCDDAVQALMDADFGEYGICKSDCTVTGPECVTIPACLESHQRHMDWPNWITALNGECRGFGNNDCGMHIHVSRASMGKWTAGKVLMFINNPAHQDFIEAIAQRPFNSWCQRKNKHMRDGFRSYGDKYETVHTLPATLEFRIFQSNLVVERVLKNIEFVHAVVTFCEDESSQYLRVSHFLNYVCQNRETYPALFDYVRGRQL